MCYDCACTLKLFIGKHFGTDDLKSTNNTQFLTSLSMAIDRFHVLNHKRAMCKTVMRPDHPCHKGVYESINTEVAEQLFSYLSKFKHSFRAYKLSEVNHILHSSVPFEKLFDYWYPLFWAKRVTSLFSQILCSFSFYRNGCIFFSIYSCIVLFHRISDDLATLSKISCLFLNIAKKLDFWFLILSPQDTPSLK
jgi:hypothetical protein